MDQGHPGSVARPPERRDATRVAAAVVWQQGRLLLTQRPPGDALGLQWEFPGGKIEPGEAPGEALIRELREELGVNATPLRVLAVDTHAYGHGLEVEITFIECILDSLEFTPGPAAHAVRWVAPAEIALGEVLAGDREFLRGLMARS